MPLYVIRNTETDELHEELCSWDRLQSFLKDNPTFVLEPAAPAIISGASGRMRTDDGFKDVLREIKKRNPGSTVNV